MVFAINLQREPARWNRLVRALDDSGVPAHRIPAIDGIADTSAVLARRGLVADPVTRVITLCNPYRGNGRPYTVSEEACFQSHVLAIETFLSSGAQFGLILEDDAVFSDDLFSDGGVICGCLGVAPKWDVVKLEGTKRGGRRLGVVYRRFPHGALFGSFRPSMGTAAYLLSRTGAEKLLSAAADDIEPFDQVLTDTRRHRLRQLDYAPFPVHQDWKMPSDIDHLPNSTSARARLMRKYSRFSRYADRVRRFTGGGGISLSLQPWVRPGLIEGIAST
ncbi:MAG TPA: glycosyltransferase family 25 protein [Fimbriimonadaceae bacterium]|nr:glycosyltransferase family 25 protein [Fimbriimonadaceae bacterium]